MTKVSKIFVKIAFILVVIIISSSYVCYANSNGLPTLGEGYRPTISVGGKTETIISNLLGALTVIGLITIVIAIAMIGFGYIMGSASEKAEMQSKFVGILIAAAIITGGSIIARIIISTAETL